jgi:dienelactone hydrolase
LRPAVVAALLFLVGGCVLHVPLAANYPGPTRRPEASVSVAGIPAPIASDAESHDRFGFTVRDLKIPAVAGGQAIDFEYYDVDGAERKPVVVLLPIFNGQLVITRFFARYFANQGWAAIVIVRGRDALGGLAAPEETLLANVADYRRVLDWAERQPEIDAARMGLLGISFGAIDAVILTALDDRIDALVTLMGGGDLSYVMVNTHYRRVARTIDALAESEGVSRETLRAAFDARITTDPLEMAQYIDAQRVLMVLARTDEIVPFEAQEALRESMGEPETLYLPTGHRPSVVYFPALRARAYEFFERQFALASTPVAAN